MKYADIRAENRDFRQIWWKETGLGMKLLPPLSCYGSWDEGRLSHFRVVGVFFLTKSPVLGEIQILFIYLKCFCCSETWQSCYQTALHSSLELRRQHGLNSRQSVQQSLCSDSDARHFVENSAIPCDFRNDPLFHGSYIITHWVERDFSNLRY